QCQAPLWLRQRHREQALFMCACACACVCACCRTKITHAEHIAIQEAWYSTHHAQDKKLNSAIQEAGYSAHQAQDKKHTTHMKDIGACIVHEPAQHTLKYPRHTSTHCPSVPAKHVVTRNKSLLKYHANTQCHE
ncbi:unnamed protein product, partial [Discosporangium mesarthrocarpum]